MSFDDYVRHMTQKYRLATAIAVLKAKPSNLSVEEYIASLKSKMTDAKDTDFLDISLGSDDFNFDDVVTNDNNDFNNNAARESLNDSVTILKDIDMDTESNQDVVHESNSLENVMNLLKEVNGKVETATKTVVKNNTTQSTFCESSQTSGINANYFDVEMQDVNNGNTQIDKDADANRSTTETEYNLSKNDEHNKVNFNNCEFNDETYSCNVNSVKNNTMQRKMAETVLNNISKETNDSLKSKTNNGDVNNKIVNKLNPISKTSITTSQNAMEDYDILIETQHAVRNNIMANKVCQNLEKANQNNIDDSQATVLYSLQGYTQDFTHVSQSQCDNITIRDNFIHGNKKYKDKDTSATETRNAIINSQIYDNSNITRTPQIIDVDSSEIQYIIDKNGHTYRVLEGVNKAGNINSTNTIASKHASDASNITLGRNVVSQELFATCDTGIQNATSLAKPDEFANICESKDKVVEEKQDLQMTQEINEILDNELTASQKEVIPFKVIEELNKIKTFMNRKMDRQASTDGYSTDSGYRSDSQSKSSFKSGLLLTGNAVNQSAHCLYTYLLQCPLVGSTADISREIAMTLGRLIDKLHENEEYPSFLEHILDSVDNLLQDIGQGDNSSNTIILTKDESIQRLLLLNKSTHVTKYTIGKITSILDKLHTYLSNEDNLYEIANIDVVENVCYIFHILEILIKRCRKAKKADTSSQDSTQNSQDTECILKKSSITDMWRKKWNPECKIAKTEGSVDKKCALTKCGEVLNRVIVDCMEGYSLISFAALQCFNLLQS